MNTSLVTNIQQKNKYKNNIILLNLIILFSFGFLLFKSLNFYFPSYSYLPIASSSSNSSPLSTTSTTDSSSPYISGYNPFHFNSYSLEQCSSYSQTLELIRQKKRSIVDRWDVDHLPQFYKSVDMSESSWKIFKLNFINALLRNNFKNKDSFSKKKEYNLSKHNQYNFVITLGGSSVHAAHDNYVYEGPSFIMYDRLLEIFNSLNLKLEVRNIALGNNPCGSYDVCVLTHAGYDTDVLVWEQSFNCGNRPLMPEMFARKFYYTNDDKLTSVIYALSGTPNWNSKLCTSSYDRNFNENEPDLSEKLQISKEQIRRIPEIRYNLDQYKKGEIFFKEDKYLIGKSFKEIATHNNYFKDIHTFNDNNVKISRDYSDISLSTINIDGIDKYKCVGPYNEHFTEKTQGGGAPWHPGKLGHEMRTDTLNFLLLNILEEAIEDLYRNGCSKSSHSSRSLRNEDNDEEIVITKYNYESVLIDNLQLYNLDSQYSPYLTPEFIDIAFNKLQENINLHSSRSNIEDSKNEKKISVLKSNRNNFLVLYSFIEAWIPYIKKNSSNILNSTSAIKTPYKLTESNNYAEYSELFSNNIKCMTNLEPRVEKLDSLTANLVLSHPYYKNPEERKKNPYNQEYYEFVSKITYEIPYSPDFKVYNYYNYNYETENSVQKTNFFIQNPSPFITPENIMTSDWEFGISFFDQNAVKKTVARGIVYNDLKYIFKSNGQGSKITFSIDVSTNNSRIWICQIQKTFAPYPKGTGELEPNGTFKAYLNYNPEKKLSEQNVADFSKFFSLIYLFFIFFFIFFIFTCFYYYIPF